MAISVVINTYNAERQLERTLRSVAAFDEIVVCDMESTDRTVAIARSYGCRVVTFPRKDHCIVEPARNFAISHASCEWVLVVDADEVVTDELRQYLYRQTACPDSPDGIFLPRRNYFMGQFMHASYPDYQLRFFRQHRVFWPAIIHTQPIVNGRVTHAPKNGNVALEHLQDSTIKARLQRTDVYTDSEYPKRMGRCYGPTAILFRPLVRFVKSYVLKGGFRDGVPGFVNACFEATYQIVMLAKIREQQAARTTTQRKESANIVSVHHLLNKNAQAVSFNNVALP